MGFYENLVSLCAEQERKTGQRTTPSGVAHAVGLSNAAATGWKRGKAPSDLTIRKIADFLKVPTDRLTDGVAGNLGRLTVFEYSGNRPVRTLNLNGEPWFVLKDVCEVLGMDTSQLKKVADRLDSDEKGRTQITTPGGIQESWVISESGLYNVILRSDKPEAKPFRKWVTAVVLPSIRKTGGYTARPISRTELMAQALLAAQDELEHKDKQIAELTRDAEYARTMCTGDNCRTVTSIAKDYGLSAEKLNSILHGLRIQYKTSDGQWVLYSDYAGRGYTRNRKGNPIVHKSGKVTIPNTTVWTEAGQRFIYEKLKEIGSLPLTERRNCRTLSGGVAVLSQQAEQITMEEWKEKKSMKRVPLSDWCKAVKKAMIDHDDMNVTELAKEIGYSRPMVSAVLNGTLVPSDALKAAIESRLNLSNAS